MPLYENVSGTWKDVLQPYANVSSTEYEILAAYEKVAGVWKAIYGQVGFTNKPWGIFDFGSGAGAILAMKAIGTYTYTTSTVPETKYGDWLTPNNEGLNDYYEINLTKNSGANPTAGSGLNTWLSMSSDRSWTWGYPGPITYAFDGTLSIRNAATLAVIDTISVSLNISAT